MSGKVLGEGAFGKVLAVDIPGCEPLCVKIIKHCTGMRLSDLKWGWREVLLEAHYMHVLAEVPGLPRFRGLIRNPPAFLMTRHGNNTLKDVLENSASINVTEVQVMQALS